MHRPLKDNGLLKFRIARQVWWAPLALVLLALGLGGQHRAHAEFPAAAPFPGSGDKMNLAYRVLLDGKPIGRHEVAIQTADQGRVQVRTDVEMAVKVLFVPVFKYEHQAFETWQDQCVTTLSSATQTNGKRSALTLLSENGRGTITREADRDAPQQEMLEGCLGTYAYWDRQRLQRAELLNGQNGERSPARLTENGAKALPGLDRLAQHFELSTPKADIQLWYADDGRWLALATDLDGRELVYLAEDLLDT
ncbi:MAG: DUF6134 family protein [Pseudomonadota bacterium]